MSDNAPFFFFTLKTGQILREEGLQQGIDWKVNLGVVVLGMVLMRKQRFAEARDAFLRASRSDPRSPKPDYQLSLAFARLGEEAASAKHRESYQQKLREMERSLDDLRKQTGLPAGGGMK